MRSDGLREPNHWLLVGRMLRRWRVVSDALEGTVVGWITAGGDSPGPVFLFAHLYPTNRSTEYPTGLRRSIGQQRLNLYTSELQVNEPTSTQESVRLQLRRVKII